MITNQEKNSVVYFTHKSKYSIFSISTLYTYDLLNTLLKLEYKKRRDYLSRNDGIKELYLRYKTAIKKTLT